MINSYGGLTFVFNLSGGSGNQDASTRSKLKATKWSFVSYKNIVRTGAVIALLMVLSTISGLSTAHVIMMLLSMYWGMSLFHGFFVTEKKEGVRAWAGRGDMMAKIAGAAAAVVISAAVYFYKPAVIILAAYVILMLLYKNKVMNGLSPEWKRVASEFNRYFVRTVAGTMLFALIPTGTFVKFNLWPNVDWVVTTKMLMAYVAGAMAAFFSFIGFGYSLGNKMKDEVNKEYKKTVAAVWSNRQGMDTAKHMIINQRLHQMNIYVDQLAYKHAGETLKEIKKELNGGISVPLNMVDRSIQKTRAGPVSKLISVLKTIFVALAVVAVVDLGFMVKGSFESKGSFKNIPAVEATVNKSASPDTNKTSGNTAKLDTSVAVAFKPVTTNGRQILRGNQPYIIHGVTVSTGHAGDSRIQVQYTLDYIGGLETIREMREMGVNSVRTYYPPTKDFLDAFARNGITVTVGFPNVDDRTGIPAEQRVDIQSGSYKDYINMYKNHPAILQWELGNEYGYHPEWFNGGVNNWYGILNNAANQIHAIDANHPVTTSQGAERGGLSTIAGVKPLNDVGLTVYRGNSLDNLVNDWKSVSAKPLYLAEFGVNYTTDPNVQAEGDAAIWGQIQQGIDQGVLSGGYLMTWKNEAWKDGANEQNLGVIDNNGNRKPAYDVMKKLWNGSAVSSMPITTQAAKTIDSNMVKSTENSVQPIKKQNGNNKQINVKSSDAFLYIALGALVAILLTFLWVRSKVMNAESSQSLDDSTARLTAAAQQFINHNININAIPEPIVNNEGKYDVILSVAKPQSQDLQNEVEEILKNSLQITIYKEGIPTILLPSQINIRFASIHLDIPQELLEGAQRISIVLNGSLKEFDLPNQETSVGANIPPALTAAAIIKEIKINKNGSTVPPVVTEDMINITLLTDTVPEELQDEVKQGVKSLITIKGYDENGKEIPVNIDLDKIISFDSVHLNIPVQAGVRMVVEVGDNTFNVAAPKSSLVVVKSLVLTQDNPVVLPSVVERIQVVEEANGSITVTWMRSDASENVTTHLISIVETKDGKVVGEPVVESTAKKLSFNYKGVSPGKSYEISVAAVNEAGISGWSKPSVMTTRKSNFADFSEDNIKEDENRKGNGSVIGKENRLPVGYTGDLEGESTNDIPTTSDMDEVTEIKKTGPVVVKTRDREETTYVEPVFSLPESQPINPVVEDIVLKIFNKFNKLVLVYDEKGAFVVKLYNKRIPLYLQPELEDELIDAISFPGKRHYASSVDSIEFRNGIAHLVFPENFKNANMKVGEYYERLNIKDQKMPEAPAPVDNKPKDEPSGLNANENTALPAPIDVEVEIRDATTVAVSMSAPEGDVKKHNIYRDGDFIGSSVIGIFLDTPVSAGTHKYTVTAVDVVNNESKHSTAVSIEVQGDKGSFVSTSVTSVGSKDKKGILKGIKNIFGAFVSMFSPKKWPSIASIKAFIKNKFSKPLFNKNPEALTSSITYVIGRALYFLIITLGKGKTRYKNVDRWTEVKVAPVLESAFFQLLPTGALMVLHGYLPWDNSSVAIKRRAGIRKIKQKIYDGYFDGWDVFQSAPVAIVSSIMTSFQYNVRAHRMHNLRHPDAVLTFGFGQSNHQSSVKSSDRDIEKERRMVIVVKTIEILLLLLLMFLMINMLMPPNKQHKGGKSGLRVPVIVGTQGRPVKVLLRGSHRVPRSKARYRRPRVVIWHIPAVWKQLMLWGLLNDWWWMLLNWPFWIIDFKEATVFPLTQNGFFFNDMCVCPPVDYWVYSGWEFAKIFTHIARTVYITIIKLTIKLKERSIMLYLVNLVSPLNQKNLVGLAGVVSKEWFTTFSFDIDYTSSTYAYTTVV